MRASGRPCGRRYDVSFNVVLPSDSCTTSLSRNNTRRPVRVDSSTSPTSAASSHTRRSNLRPAVSGRRSDTNAVPSVPRHVIRRSARINVTLRLCRSRRWAVGRVGVVCIVAFVLRSYHGHHGFTRFWWPRSQLFSRRSHRGFRGYILPRSPRVYTVLGAI